MQQQRQLAVRSGRRKPRRQFSPNCSSPSPTVESIVLSISIEPPSTHTPQRCPSQLSNPGESCRPGGPFLRFAAECPLDWLVWVRRGLSEPLHGLSGLLGWLWRSCSFRCHSSSQSLSFEGLYVQFLCADACCQIICG